MQRFSVQEKNSSTYNTLNPNCEDINSVRNHPGYQFDIDPFAEAKSFDLMSIMYILFTMPFF